MSNTSTAATSAPSKSPFQMPPLSAEHQATAHVAARFHELITSGQNLTAIQELYADAARHVEVMAGPGCDRIVEGKATLLEKAEKFHKSMTVHSASCGKPVINGDQFVCPMQLDATASEGPMAGHRMNMQETALYTVKNGKITEAKFFYALGC